jgi:hypothetical protein
MRLKTIGLLAVTALAIAACGQEAEFGAPDDPDAPVLQVRSEGGFAPVEFVLGRGPTYTLLADGRLLYQGPSVTIYPGPLVPQYRISQISEDQMDSVLDIVEEMGLPDMVDELDDGHGQTVADATTEVVTYWDSAGEHRYSVYALGIEPNPENPATKAFADLLILLDQLTASSDAGVFEPDRVQVIAGPGFNQGDAELLEWPLDDTDFADWETLPNGWECKVHEADVLDSFEDALQNTVWSHPDPSNGDLLTLLVRPLHPGEPDCPNG